MPLYKRPGSPYWHVSFTDAAGRRHRESTGTEDKRQAQEYLDKLTAQRWSIRVGRKPDYTWEQAVNRWLDERSSKETIKDDMSMLRWWNKHLAGLPLKKITRDLVLWCMNEKRKESSPSRANRYAALLRAIFNAALKDWCWIEAGDVPRVRLFPEPKKRVRYLTKEQVTDLLSNLNGHQRDMAEFALCTGMRQGNIKNLRWSEVDMKRKVLHIAAEQMKNGMALGIPLNAGAMSVLERRRGIHPEFVFTYHGQPVKQVNTKAWKDALKKAGISNYRWHDNRHTWASTMIQSGVPLHILKVLGGWQNSAMVERYAHLAPEHLHQYAAVIDGLTNGDREEVAQSRHSQNDGETQAPDFMVPAAGIEPATCGLQTPVSAPC